MICAKFGEDWTRFIGEVAKKVYSFIQNGGHINSATSIRLAVTNKLLRKSKRHGITFVRLGLTMMCANSGEDWTIIEGGVAKKRVFLKFKMVENLYNRKLKLW